MKLRSALCVFLILVMTFAVFTVHDRAKADELQTADPYPRTKVNFLYDDYSFWNTSGEARTINCMIIPVHFTDGYGFDKLFDKRVFSMMKGKDSFSARQYYLNASYGKIDLQYEIMPVYEVGISSWDMEDLWNSAGEINWYGEHYWQIYNAACARYPGDLSKFDTDNDGYADLVMMIFDDPSVDGEDDIGTLYGGKVVSIPYDHCVNSADHEYPSCTHVMCLEKYHMMYDQYRNTLIHEIGHMFGVSDLYNGNDAEGYESHTPLGFDMHDTETGDLNAWTKMSFGWIDPYVITPDIEEVTIRLRCSALYPDCILIPTSKGWNGTPFDEFILVEVLAKAGNNERDWDDFMLWPAQKNDPPRYGGVRILHVDQRMCYPNDYATGTGGSWFDPSAVTDYDKKAIWKRGAVLPGLPIIANSMGIKDSTWYSPDKQNGDYYNLHSMTRTNEDPLFQTRFVSQGWYDFIASDLFQTGDRFSMESHATAFANAPYMNNYGTFDYEIIIDSYNSATMEALVTVRRIR